MATTPSLQPLPDREFGYLQAQHLLNRAGFGGTARQISALQTMGLAKAVDLLVDYDKVDAGRLPHARVDPDLMGPPSEQERRMYQEARRTNDQATLDRIEAERLARQAQDRTQMHAMQQWWLARMIATPRPLEEKLTLFWHGHFASQHRKVRDSYLLMRQNQLFRSHAAGNFADLLIGSVRDPAMIRFLDNQNNNRNRPNENLARELMELFALGEGQYSEQDIKQGARALTGYSVDDNDFIFRKAQHDSGPKTILGVKGNHNGDDFARILLARRACAEFIAGKLYRFFVAEASDTPDDTSKQVIAQLARELFSQKYELRPVLKLLFRSRHFYDGAIAGNMIKSPAQFIVGTVRVLNTPTRQFGVVVDAMNTMGQELFDPPSVAGWPGGRMWINTSTLYVRQNLAAYLITNKLPFDKDWDNSQLGYDPMFLIEDLPSRTPEAVVDHLTATLLGPTLDPRRDELVHFVKSRNMGITRDTLIALLLLITALPEYQLC